MSQYLKCPNCGREYPKSDLKYYCGNCNYKLEDEDKVTNVKHPELSKRDYKVIGEIGDPTKPSPKCPTCSSTNIRKMSGIDRGASIATFGLFSKKINKTFKCGNCGYTW